MARKETMKMKEILPKDFGKRLRALKRLDDDLGISINFQKKKKSRRDRNLEVREKLLESVWESWPRKMILNEKVLQMRGNALKNAEVKALLKKTGFGIEDCALASLWDERHAGQENDCPANTSPENLRSHLAEFHYGNNWRIRLDYYWGGPKDPVKILFQESKNYRYKVIGVIQMFPKKKKAA